MTDLLSDVAAAAEAWTPLELDLLALEEANPHALGVGPSDIGRCPAQVAFRVREVEPDRPEDRDLIRKAALGKAIHAAVAEARKLAHPDWLVEVQVQPPGLSRPGTVDAYMTDLGVVDDVKTKSERGFDAILGRGKAYDEDRDQTNVYALAIEDMGHPVKTCSVTYVERSGNRPPFVDSWTYDREEAMGALMRLHALEDAIESGGELPRTGRGPELGRPCDTCRWPTKCWGVVPAGYSTQSYTLAPPQVAEAGTDLVTLKKQRDAIEEAIEFRRAQLQGHNGAVFTDDEGIVRKVAWTKPGPPKQVTDADAAADLLKSHDLPVPTKPGRASAPQLRTPAVK